MQLHSLRAVAKMLDLRIEVVSYLVDAHGIQKHRIPTNGRAIGIDESGLRKLRKDAEKTRKLKSAS